MSSKQINGDEAVQATNDDAALCKRSAVQLGYWKDPFLQYFVRASERKAPEINRGYYARVEGIKHLVSKTLQIYGKNCQIISVGAGFDTLFWRLKEDGKVVKNFVEVDFPSVTTKKCYYIKRAKPLLQHIATDDGEVKLNVSDLHGSTYHVIGCDLRNLDDLSGKLKDCAVDFRLPTIVLSECVLVYMETVHSKNLLKWLAEHFQTCLFINYEQVNMDDRFGQVMMENLKARGCTLAGVESCKNLESQNQRFLQNGWSKARSWQMNQVYELIPRADVQRIEKIEFLDEKELLDQLFQHYCICVAFKDERKMGLGAVCF